MREQLRIGSTLSWVIAWALAIAAPLVYLLAPSGIVWWVLMPALVMPLVGLAEWRREHRGLADGGSVAPADPGPLGPPDAGGC